MRYRFNEFVLDTDRFELTKHGESLHVEPQIIELLALLMENRARMVSKDEINEKIWRGRIVSEAALSSRIKMARKILGDDGRKQLVIRTIHKKGFRFVAELEPDNLLAEENKPLRSGTYEAPTIQDDSIKNQLQKSTHAIAVLPFSNLSSDTEQEYFSDGLTNDIITDLSRFGSPSVVAAHSSFAYKDRSMPVQDIASELGARYVLEGSVQKVGQRLRINVQLNDVLSAQQIWTERYNRGVGDLFEVQEEIVATIIGTLSHKVDSAEFAQSESNTNADAYDCYMKGREIFFGRTKNCNLESHRLLEQAIQLDPQFARAYGFLAWLHVHDYRNGWSANPDISLENALELALRALALGPSDPDCHWRLGFVYLYRRQFDKAMVEYEKAKKLNPNHAGFLAEMAGALIYVGRTSEAIAQTEQAMKIDSQHPEWFYVQLGWAYYEVGRYNEALKTLKKMNNPPGIYLPFIAATLVQLGFINEATTVTTELLKKEPRFNLKAVQLWPYQDLSRQQRIEDDLRLAGVPE